jgi:hypothetical protein
MKDCDVELRAGEQKIAVARRSRTFIDSRVPALKIRSRALPCIADALHWSLWTP